jgi:tetratricopeptide (TPR) repeat protein
MKKEKSEKDATVNERFNDFVKNYRTSILIGLGAILLALVGFIAAFSVSNALRKKAIGTVEELASRYEALLPLPEDAAAIPELGSSELLALLNDIETFAKKTSGYAGGRAWALLAAVHGEKKEWPETEVAWAGAAKAAGKTYLAPIAWFNAAAAAEEQGRNEQAIEYYARSLESPEAFPSAPQAQFSIGRLKEGIGDSEGALEAYRALVFGVSYDTVWKNLAQSRILVLEAQAQ